VGYSDTHPSGQFHAFLWEAGTGMQDLGTLGGGQSVARGINARGQVVGHSFTSAFELRAFLWEAGTGMQDLGILGDSEIRESDAFGINARGQVVGYSTTADEFGANLDIRPRTLHAILWEPGEEVVAVTQ
jgi:probable HAF family extracellular repeat protein